MHNDPDDARVAIVTADHPTFHGGIEGFFGELRNEPRFFGPSASRNPKPFPSLIDALSGRGGFRLAAVDSGRLIGLARVDGAGVMSIAVVKDRRRAGVGTALVRAAADRAAELHYRRIVLHTTRRSAAVRQLATHVGWLVITGDRGRTEVFLDVAVDADAAGSIRSA